MTTSAAEHEHTVNHESAHAAAAALLGIVPVCVEVGANPTVAAGRTWLRPSESSPAVERRWAQVLLAGWVGNGEDPPRWPSEQAGKGTDERKLAEVASYLDLDPSGYRALIRETWELAARPEFVRLEVGFRTALAYRRVLDAPVVARVLFAALGHEQTAALYGVEYPSTQEEEDEQ